MGIKQEFVSGFILSRRDVRKRENNQYIFAAPWISEMYILAMLSHGDSYGYEIAKSNKINLSESTVYPILRRLEKAGCLESSSQLCDSKLRKSYRITGVGQEQLTRFKERWTELNKSIENILGGWL